MKSVVERRVHVRHPVSLKVYVSPAGAADFHLESRIINMSLLGCAIELGSYKFSKREKISLCFAAVKENCSASTTIEAKVCHVADSYIGICFDAISSDVMALLRETLQEAKYF